MPDLCSLLLASRTLAVPEGRRKYLAGPILTNGQPDISGGWSEGRRIDYLLYREHPGPAELRTVSRGRWGRL